MNDKNLHIVHIIPWLGFGGAERSVVDLVNHSNPLIRYTIILFFDHKPFATLLTSSNVQIKVVQKHGKLSLGLLFALKKLLKQLQPDVVHTHLFGGDVWGRLAAKSLGIPIVTTEHGFNREEHFVKHFMRWLLRNYSDQYIVPSHGLKNFLITQGGVTKPVEVVPHGVEMKRFNKIKSLNFSKPFQLVMIGRLVKQKGFNLALSALAALQDINWKLTIVGSGSEKKALQKLTQLLRIQDRVLFVDAQERVEDILQDQHILIVPSRSAEGLGIVAMEGMCAGRFVLVSMVEGLVEVVTSDMYGLRFKVNDGNDLKKKLLWCFNHPDDVMSVAKKGRAYALQHFDVSSMVTEYEKIYFKLAKNRAFLP